MLLIIIYHPISHIYALLRLRELDAEHVKPLVCTANALLVCVESCDLLFLLSLLALLRADPGGLICLHALTHSRYE